MNLPRLESVAITNFRSIKGAITVPLGAPVVLIHGTNGAGKTSVLSAIELALCGEVTALRRSEPNYHLHLLHRGTDEGRIRLNFLAGELQVRSSGGDTIITATGPRIAPLLDKPYARFFAERCYLAQSTLGRLLEIYQHAEVGDSESPLTKFVKDVLGLDQLDAIVAGLNAADDVRRIRKLVPEYRDVEDVRDVAQGRIAKAESTVRQFTARLDDLRTRVRQTLSALPEGATLAAAEILDSMAVERLISNEQEEAELVELTRYDRELSGLKEDWNSLAASPEAAAVEVAEREEKTAREAVEKWRSSTGEQLERIIDNLRKIFPDLPALASTDPKTAVATALQRASAEIERCNELISGDDQAGTALIEVDGTIERAQARLRVIDEQIGELSGDAADLAHALAAILPHIHGEECPVCGRNFADVSSEPLAIRLSGRIAQLTERAGRLEALAKARAESIGHLAASQRQRGTLTQRRLQQSIRVTTKGRVAELSEARRRLEGLTEAASSGSALLQQDAEARGRLAALRERSERTTALREAVLRLCRRQLGEVVTANEATQPTPVLLNLVGEHVTTRTAALTKVQTARRQLASEYRQLGDIELEIKTARESMEVDQIAVRRAKDRLEAAEVGRSQARLIAAAAKRVRSTIVSRVFNDSLNAVWRELFVRLAPDEPFVPAFKLPESADAPVVAALETIHRAGGHAGAPGAMLSAGNLNTAALTLFLALHLSVRVRLPWLVLDDPVQSMDEVHVSQFAALLRTLSKEHNRQIVIAVHDRALFDYLALELSPAFADDQLITVELGRSADGDTLAEPNYRTWEPDPAIAVG